MTRFLIVIALLGLSCGAASADSLILSPTDQTLPVSTSATLDVTFLMSLPRLDFIDFTFTVVSGPDAGENGGVVLLCAAQCFFDFSITNGGMAGMDNITVEALDLSFPFPIFESATVTWTPTSSVPEPSFYLFLSSGLAGILALRRRLSSRGLPQ